MDLNQLIALFQGIAPWFFLSRPQVLDTIKYLAEPWQQRRIAKAKGMGETDAMIDREERFAEANKTLIDEQTRELPLALKPLVVEEVRKQINLITTLQKVVNDDVNPLTPEDLVGAKVSEDWLYRWKNYAEKVSNQDIQIMWAKILKGEIKKPKTSSYRLMDFMDKLSEGDIEKISFVFSCFGLYMSDQIDVPLRFLMIDGNVFGYEFWENKDHFGSINYLNELGLLVDKYIPKPEDSENGRFLFRCQNADLKIPVKGIQTQAPTFSGYVLTTLGRQLFDLSEILVSQEYIDSIYKDLKASSISFETHNTPSATLPPL